ncbi:nuclear transport factor 2 family protein [Streptomyces sp. NBC_00335]|uniref:nuclear transport factor 2 family protein n=1 Tax=unclassified Streptomyces TaxID=2593676 RepID=UPI002252DA22|nr:MULTISPECIES: nuclear transport factor 2 family protein [unclassified Streptomyces]MCX5406301.1 nuclear transport factor 2 family protein [Streptomyces sp. NBC_00086]
MPTTDFAPERRRMLTMLGTGAAVAGLGALASAAPASAASEDLSTASYGSGPAGSAEDELAINRLLETYLFAVDTKDKTVFRTLFTDDAVLTVMAHPDGTAGIVKSGIEAVVANLDGAAAWGHSTHVTANAYIRVTGRYTATGDSHATAQLVYPATATAPETVVVRGIRYRDEYVRSAGVWKIRKRIFSPLWQYNGTAVQINYPN